MAIMAKEMVAKADYGEKMKEQEEALIREERGPRLVYREPDIPCTEALKKRLNTIVDWVTPDEVWTYDHDAGGCRRKKTGAGNRRLGKEFIAQRRRRGGDLGREKSNALDTAYFTRFNSQIDLESSNVITTAATIENQNIQL
jgi:hypothetical protein